MAFVRVNLVGPKYVVLEEYLKTQQVHEIIISFKEIEAILTGEGDPPIDLPKSAYTYRQWWANNRSHTQARAWLNAGWEVKSVDFKTKMVTFSRK